jgi:uncharacterized cupin superfamily protein
MSESSPTEHRGILVQRAESVPRAADFQRYVPREPGGAGSLNYGTDNEDQLSSVKWLKERHMSSLGVPLSAGLFHMEPSEFAFGFVAEETMVFLTGAVEITVEGEEVKLRAGDMAFFPAGLQTHWRVAEPTTLFFTLLD